MPLSLYQYFMGNDSVILYKEPVTSSALVVANQGTVQTALQNGQCRCIEHVCMRPADKQLLVDLVMVGRCQQQLS